MSSVSIHSGIGLHNVPGVFGEENKIHVVDVLLTHTNTHTNAWLSYFNNVNNDVSMLTDNGVLGRYLAKALDGFFRSYGMTTNMLDVNALKQVLEGTSPIMLSIRKSLAALVNDGIRWFEVDEVPVGKENIRLGYNVYSTIAYAEKDPTGNTSDVVLLCIDGEVYYYNKYTKLKIHI